MGAKALILKAKKMILIEYIKSGNNRTMCPYDKKTEVGSEGCLKCAAHKKQVVHYYSYEDKQEFGTVFCKKE